MFSRVLKPVSVLAAQNGAKNLSTTAQNNYKVVVCGAAGGIGQPLSLLLKMNPLVSHLALYDVAPVTPGVGADLSHMNTPARVTAHKGPEELPKAIEGADLVVIPAGVPRKPGMTRDDLFNTNASIVLEITKVVSAKAPKAVMAIITNPVNSMVPIAAEVHKKMGTYDPHRVLGVTTLDVVRSNAFIGEIINQDPRTVDVPVIGGHSGVTILPVISQTTPCVSIEADKLDKLTRRIQEAGTEVVKAKAGGGSATLSMAFAGHRLANAVLRGKAGEGNVYECTYLENDLTEASFFATKCLFGANGVETVVPFGKLTDYEQKLLKEAIPELIKNIKTGVDFAKAKA